MRKDIFKKNESGLSLIEVIVYMTLTSIILAALFAVFVNFTKVTKQNEDLATAANKGQLISSVLENTARSNDTCDPYSGDVIYCLKTDNGVQTEQLIIFHENSENNYSFWIVTLNDSANISDEKLQNAIDKPEKQENSVEYTGKITLRNGKTNFFDANLNYHFSSQVEDSVVDFSGQMLSKPASL